MNVERNVTPENLRRAAHVVAFLGELGGELAAQLTGLLWSIQLVQQYKAHQEELEGLGAQQYPLNIDAEIELLALVGNQLPDSEAEIEALIAQAMNVYDGRAEAIRPKVRIVEVTKEKVGEGPQIDIFRVILSDEHGDWPETIGSLEQLQAFLLGTKITLHMDGYPSHSVGWEIPKHWLQPSGKRWTMEQGGDLRTEDLTANGWHVAI